MHRYILKRLFMMIPVLLGVTIVVFAMLQITPGDPARSILGDEATQEELEEKREELGLNDPLVIQYFRYLNDMLHGDLGESYTSGKPVLTEVLQRFPTTMQLTLIGISVSVILGILLGVTSAVNKNKMIDKVVTVVGMVGISMPAFWIGLLLSQVFALHLHWLPATGFYGPKYFILPALTVGINGAAAIMRTTRSSMLEVIRQDYIRTAQAKGAPRKSVIYHHALKNSLIPVITVAGLRIGIQLGGAMVVEMIFSIPGLGSYLVDAISFRDYPSVMGGVLIIAVTFSLVNLLVDILYAFVDPRIKSQYSGGKRIKLRKEAAA